MGCLGEFCEGCNGEYFDGVFGSRFGELPLRGVKGSTFFSQCLLLELLNMLP